MPSFVRIVQTPQGEAPLWVREEWVGLELPLVRDEPVRSWAVSVLTSRNLQTWLEGLWATLTGKTKVWTGYIVSVDRAVEILALSSPPAAEWWRKNTPHIFGREFLFDAPACDVVQLGRDPTANDG